MEAAIQLVESFKLSTNATPGGHHITGDLNGGPKASLTGYAESLYPKYKKQVGDLPHSWLKTNMVIQMENWTRAVTHARRYLQEATTQANVTTWDKFAFPMIRTILPELATEKCFTLQPMLGPTSQIFTLTPVYGETRGTVTAGQPLYENHDPDYGNDQIDDVLIGTGTGSSQTIGNNATLSHTPIVPGSLQISDGTSQFLSDDGAGNLIGNGSGSINYTTGVVSGLSWTANVANGSSVTASYSVDNEINEAGIPQIDLTLTSSFVQARRKALRLNWSLPALFAMRDQYGVDGEAELIQAAGAEIAFGIDNQNFRNVVNVAVDKTADSALQFNNTTPSGISRSEHRTTIIETFLEASSFILKNSGRAIGNWVLGSEKFSTIIESMGAPRFVATPSKATRGIQLVGVLDNRFNVFRTVDPAVINLTETTSYTDYLMGSKQPDFLHAGYVFAPWILAFETPTTILDDMKARKAIASLYAQKVVNNKFYVKLRITNISS